MDLVMIKAVIERGMQGRVQINIAKQLGITANEVAYILKEHRNGRNINWIKQQIDKGAAK